jgi:hypothetical protein
MTEDTIDPQRRPEIGFDVIIELYGAPNRKFVSPRLAAALQDVYDIAVNSMDFGSGFLDTDEIENLRELGKAIGAEPLHYQCNRRPARVIQYPHNIPFGSPLHVGDTIPALPCTCGAEAPVIDGEVIEDQEEASTRAIES